jgi:hypothetical protein
MAFSRYTRAPRLNFGAQFGTSVTIQTIRAAISDGRLATQTMVVRGAERLDTIAGVVYGDSRYWWILAAASDIGWGLQVPSGTIIKIPNLGDVSNLVTG